MKRVISKECCSFTHCFLSYKKLFFTTVIYSIITGCSPGSKSIEYESSNIPDINAKKYSYRLPDEFERIIDEQIAINNVPGVVAGFWSPKIKDVVFEKGFANLESKEKMTISHHFRIGSITKSFVTTLILMLIDEKKLSMNDKIRDLNLPFTIHNDNANIKSLGNMTSGIYNYSEDSVIIEQLLQKPTKKVSELDLIEAANRHDPYFEVGHSWYYSNTNTVILGLIVENIKKEPLSVLFEKIFKTTLKNTIYPIDASMRAPVAQGYFFDGEKLVNFTSVDPNYSAGSGAMVSTLDDLKIWVSDLVEGKYLSSKLQEERLKMLDSKACKTCPDYDEYGFGIGRIGEYIGHTGSYIGYQSLAMYNRQNKSVVVILTNSSPSGIHVPTNIFKEFTKDF